MQIIGGQDNSTQAMQAFLSSLLPTLPGGQQGQQQSQPMLSVAGPSGPTQVTIVGSTSPLQVVIVGNKPGRAGVGPQQQNDQQTQRRELFSQAVDKGTSAAGQMYGQGSSFMKSMAGAADPFSTIATLEGSITQLSITVGRQFAPLIDDVSLKIQQAARWFGNLDESVKSSAAKTVFWATAAAGIVVAGAKVVATIRMIATAMAAARVAMMTNPVTVILSTVAALATLKLAWDGITNSARSAGEASRNAGPDRRRAENAISSKDLESLPQQFKERIAAAGGDRAKVTLVLQDFQKKAAEDLAKMQGQMIPDMDRRRQRDDLVNQAFDRSGLTGRINRYRASDEKEMQEAGERWKGMGGFWEVGRQTNRFFNATNNFLRGDGFMPDQRARSQYDPAAVRDNQRERSLAVAQSMLPSAMKALKEAGVTEKQEDVFARLLAAVRRDDADPMKDREGRDVLSASDPRRFAAQQAGLKIEGQLRQLEDRKKLADDLLNKSGGRDELQRSLRGLPSTRIMDPTAFSDAIQQAVLTGDDLDAQNKADQLQALVDSKELLTDIRANMVELNLKSRDKWRY